MIPSTPKMLITARVQVGLYVHMPVDMYVHTGPEICRCDRHKE